MKRYAVRLKESGVTFMTSDELNKALDDKEVKIEEYKRLKLIVRKGSPSTEYNRVCIDLDKRDMQGGQLRYYEIFHLKRESGLIVQMMGEIQRAQDWGYEIEFQGFVEEDEE
jgi:hypothetical protein